MTTNNQDPKEIMSLLRIGDIVNIINIIDGISCHAEITDISECIHQKTRSADDICGNCIGKIGVNDESSRCLQYSCSFKHHEKTNEGLLILNIINPSQLQQLEEELFLV